MYLDDLDDHVCYPCYDDDDQMTTIYLSLYLSLMFEYSLDAGTHKRAGTTNISNCERNQ